MGNILSSIKKRYLLFGVGAPVLLVYLYFEIKHYLRRKKEELLLRNKFTELTNSQKPEYKFPHDEFKNYLNKANTEEISLFISPMFNGTQLQKISDESLKTAISYYICYDFYKTLDGTQKDFIDNYVNDVVSIIRSKTGNPVDKCDDVIHVKLNTAWTLTDPLFAYFGTLMCHNILDNYLSRYHNVKEEQYEIPMFTRIIDVKNPTVVILAGLTSGLSGLLIAIPAIPEKYNIVFPIHPITHNIPYSTMDILEYSTHIVTYLKNKGLTEQVHVSGWSFGGGIAGILKTKFNNVIKFKSFTLIEPAGFYPGSPAAYYALVGKFLDKLKLFNILTNGKYCLANLGFAVLTHYYQARHIAYVYPPFRNTIWNWNDFNDDTTTVLLSSHDFVSPPSENIRRQLNKAKVFINEGHHGSWCLGNHQRFIDIFRDNLMRV